MEVCRIGGRQAECTGRVKRNGVKGGIGCQLNVGSMLRSATCVLSPLLDESDDGYKNIERGTRVEIANLKAKEDGGSGRGLLPANPPPSGCSAPDGFNARQCQPGDSSGQTDWMPPSLTTNVCLTELPDLDTQGASHQSTVRGASPHNASLILAQVTATRRSLARLVCRTRSANSICHFGK